MQPETSPQSNDLQQNAAVQPHAPAPQVPPDDEVTSTPEDYTISVEQVRDYLRQKGLNKSKDTIQRWCRTGDLECRKMGLLNRFFTTEASLLALEKKLLPDMIAENAGVTSRVSTSMPQPAADANIGVQQHAGDQDTEISGMQLREGEDAGERSGTKENTMPNAAASSSTPKHAATQVAELQAQVAGLTSQLEQMQSMNEFLKEEIVSARGQRGDVVKIAEQMLGTLETIAVGGRLEKPGAPAQSSGPDPVSYQQARPDQGEV